MQNKQLSVQFYTVTVLGTLSDIASYSTNPSCNFLLLVQHRLLFVGWEQNIYAM